MESEHISLKLTEPINMPKYDSIHFDLDMCGFVDNTIISITKGDKKINMRIDDFWKMLEEYDGDINN